MPFIPHTEDDVRTMLAAIGVGAIDDLFDEIPASLQSAALTRVPPGANEMEITRLMFERAERDFPPSPCGRAEIAMAISGWGHENSEIFFLFRFMQPNPSPKFLWNFGPPARGGLSEAFVLNA